MRGTIKEEKGETGNPKSPVRVAEPVTPVQDTVGQYNIVFQPIRRKEQTENRRTDG